MLVHILNVLYNTFYAHFTVFYTASIWVCHLVFGNPLLVHHVYVQSLIVAAHVCTLYLAMPVVSSSQIKYTIS